MSNHNRSRDADHRENREATTREQQAAKRTYSWGPQASLAAPPPRAGMEQRWVRDTLGREDDLANLSRRENQGWVPRSAESVNSGFYTEGQKRGGRIRVRGMVLMERPRELGDEHRGAIKDMTDRQQTAVKQKLMEGSYVYHGMKPFIDSETRSVVETGRPSRVADD